ncbi:MAG: DUF2975 domain-containing protein [Oceanospirillales bacterium]|nr:DUF2975 domain-containing protein [Oceanospirillales bacterium]
MHSDNTSTAIKKTAFWLNLLILGTLALSLGEMMFTFASDIPVTLSINGEFWTRPISGFEAGDRVVLVTLISLGKLLWIGVLYQFWTLCSLYKRNQIFTVANARCFKHTGVILVMIAVVEVALVPAIGGYLMYRAIIPKMPDIKYALLFNLDTLVPGVFFWLIARIMESAAAMKDESELTI